ncbi:hypothetical protein BJ944DRAFT_265852 [Cunninghamella echinulata]|nr:hypothetical protein BJ944DRAFT_265852 [Cunninghamella echinulata]
MINELPMIQLETTPFYNSWSNRKSASFQVQWLYFNQSRWIPLNCKNYAKLESAIEMGGCFVDIKDSNFPSVDRVRVFPKLDYISYLGMKFRICRLLLPGY